MFVKRRLIFISLKRNDLICLTLVQVNAQQPEALFGLSDKVKEQFSERIARLSDDEIHSHQKVAAFKDSIGNASKQSKAVEFFFISL